MEILILNRDENTETNGEVAADVSECVSSKLLIILLALSVILFEYATLPRFCLCCNRSGFVHTSCAAGAKGYYCSVMFPQI